MSKAGSSAPLRSRSGWSKCAIRALTAPTDDGSGGAFKRVSLAAFVRRPQAERQIGARRIIAEVLLPLRTAAANRFSPPAGPLRAAPRALLAQPRRVAPVLGRGLRPFRGHRQGLDPALGGMLHD